ncbi:hypothetical protein R1sor_023090 [Riccia sorocarpa]|uniref:Uncharacterized protein n=1 Tax=Riccia sorocarpa TaxID=122646 RepID=A0ABD3GSN3_9MARC
MGSPPGSQGRSQKVFQGSKVALGSSSSSSHGIKPGQTANIRPAGNSGIPSPAPGVQSPQKSGQMDYKAAVSPARQGVADMGWTKSAPQNPDDMDAESAQTPYPHCWPQSLNMGKGSRPGVGEAPENEEDSDGQLPNIPKEERSDAELADEQRSPTKHEGIRNLQANSLITHTVDLRVSLTYSEKRAEVTLHQLSGLNIVSICQLDPFCFQVAVDSGKLKLTFLPIHPSKWAPNLMY